MRLQLQIFRHALPPVSILFATASSPSSQTASKGSTISNLLHDVNDIVPLESTDGEWGLEDYVVELPSLTEGDFDNFYECLHYQTIESVLREDDDVIIRCLGSDELRERRRGGRMQITSDGRHLIDGVVFGRKWIKPTTEMGRPGVVIPPRKKRRLLMQEEDLEIPDDVGEGLLGAADSDDEDEDDEDYVGDIEDDKENMRPDKSVRVRLRFDNIDRDVDESEDSGSSVEDVGEDELQKLLMDAEDLDGADEPVETLERQLMTRSSLGKRKRIAAEEDQDEEEFYGFSTPNVSPLRKRIVREPSVSDSESETGVGSGSETESDSDSDSDSDTDLSVSSDSIADPIDGVAEEEDTESDDDYDGSTSSTSGSSSISDGGQRIEEAPGAVLDPDETSSSGSSRSNSDDDSSDVSSTSGESSIVPSEDRSKTSASNESRRDVLSDRPSTNHVKGEKSEREEGVRTKPLPVPPGDGMQKTKRNNNRVKKRKRLQALKAEGILDSDASFADLQAYDDGELEAARQKALATVNVEDDETSVDKSSLQVETEDHEMSVVQSEGAIQPPSREPSPKAATPSPLPSAGSLKESGQTSATPSAQRSRLDIAASRRLLFGSLGLRTPKTSEEEQALREKLTSNSQRTSGSAKQPDDPQFSTVDGNVDTIPNSELWREKLIITAVDCDRGGRVLPPPPFPFEQKWWKKKGVSANSDQLLDYDGVAEHRNDQAASAMNHDNGRDGSASRRSHCSQTSNNQSRTLSFEKEDDGIFIPTNYESLVSLQTDHHLPGAVIAYKELYVDVATNFQPEVSPYRVARLISVGPDNDLATVCLATKDRLRRSAGDGDEQETTNPFEVDTGQDDVIDDGIREVSFTAMIEPKLVEASNVQVPNSNPSQMGGDGHASPTGRSSAVIPESEPGQEGDAVERPTQIEVEQLEVNTPRRKEITTTIIKDAGFDSAVDELLLQLSSTRSSPLLEGSHKSVEDLSAEGLPSADQGSHSSPKHATVAIHPSHWNSSLLLPAEDGDSQVAIDTDADAHPNVSYNVSSPPISPQLTVDYPHVSQLDLTTSTPAFNDGSRHSSSHQDAQRLSPAPNADLSFSISEEKENVLPNVQAADVAHDADDQPLDSLRSQVPMSQAQSPQHDDGGGQDQTSPNTSSFLGVRGYDGHDSSYHNNHSRSQNSYVSDIAEHESSSDDDDSLPSLRELTNSQKPKITDKDTVRHLASQTSARNADMEANLSPPPLKRVTRSSAALDTSSEAGEDRPSSQPQTPLKVSNSQHESTRMSQIPLASQVVDLTQSSVPASPENGNGEYSAKTKAMLNKTVVGKKSSKSKTKQTNGKGMESNGIMKPRKAVSDLSPMSETMENGGWIGTRRFLTQKKSRSQI